MTASIKPLSNSQKLFLQQLMVAHVLSDNEARDLYNSIRDKFANVEPDEDNGADPAFMGNGFDHNLGLINVSLKNAFNLEICTVFLPAPYDPDNEPTAKSSSLIKYHAVVNKSNDAHAKSYASSPSHYGPHEHAYLRLLLEKLIERGNEIDTNVGCAGVLNKMDILNSRTDLEGAHANKLTVSQTEAALELFVMEKWLVEMSPPGEGDDSDAEDEEEEDRPKKKRKSKGGDRRKSLKGTYYGIGPRCFLELGEFLQGAGLPEERMPQTIINLP